MARVKQSKEELRAHLKEQFEFLISSCQSYDAGFTAEAKRIAATIRLMVHDTKQSHSLFSQLEIKSIGFLNTAARIRKENNKSALAFLQITIVINDDRTISGKPEPLLGVRPDGWPRARKIFFSDWWNQTVLTDMAGTEFKRRTLVMSIANTDGGAHVDPEIDATYASLSRNNSIGYAVAINDDIKTIDKVELACIRQIAYELTVSVFQRHPEFFPHKFHIE